MNGIFIIIGVVIVLLLILTPMGRTIARSAKNLFLADAMSNPKAAKAVFLTAIEDAQKKKAQVADLHHKLSGRLIEADRNMKDVNKELENTVSKMERVVASGGSDEDLSLLNDKRLSLLQRQESINNILIELKPRVEEAAEAQRLLDAEVRKLKEQKDLKIAEMETAKAIADTYKQLDGIDVSATGKLLEKFNDNLATVKRSADGGRAVHENKLETREAHMNKRLAALEGDEFIRQLKAKHDNSNAPNSNNPN
ncbi:MAG: hypothetical protein FWC91_02290 [Defluviitaleaceae bacterium]|nr:hypothetical protein [Defluviitaleaceae bacterium]